MKESERFCSDLEKKEAILTLPHTDPLPETENRLEGDGSRFSAGTEKISRLWGKGPRTEEQKKLMREGRKAAIPKGFYIAAIRTYCLECSGSPFLVRNCATEGQPLHSNDGKPCPFYAIRTIPAMRKVTKTGLRRAIKANCVFCIQGFDESGCTSLKCRTYRFRFGRRLDDRKGVTP